MNVHPTVSPNLSGPLSCQQQFVAMLPKLQQHLRREFRKLKAEAADEALSEGIANCFQHYARLYEQDRVDAAFPSTLAKFAARQVRAGRKVGGSLNVRDPLSEYAQAKKTLHRVRNDRHRDMTGDWVEAVLADRRASVPERVALRIDVPQWLRGLAVRMRRIAKDLAVGCTTREVASKYGLSAGRISQIRLELYNSWLQFHGELGGC